MNRKDEFKSGSSNPAQYFLEWKSDKKCFEFYDKEASKKIEVKLPFKFLTLKEMHTVKGFNDANQCGVYSNEVQFIGKDTINVRTFKGGISIEGIYKEIKPKIEAIGGVYHKSIYAMSEKGELINISFKGSCVQAWSEFTQKQRNRLADEWVIIKDALEAKKGKVTYSVPVFGFERSLNASEGGKADLLYDTIDNYIKGYVSERKTDIEVDVLPAEFDNNDAPPF